MSDDQLSTRISGTVTIKNHAADVCAGELLASHGVIMNGAKLTTCKIRPDKPEFQPRSSIGVPSGG
jgi:hypothetical protein